MALAPHRQTPDRSRELRERAWALAEDRLRGGGVICARCGATCATMDERCAAALDEHCPGGEALAAALHAAWKDVGLA